MKYLLLLALVVAIVWFWRTGKKTLDRGAATPPSPPPLDMVRCAHCGLHVPQADAVGGPGGTVFCSAEHRAAAPK